MHITWVCNIPLKAGREVLARDAMGSGHWLDALRDVLGAAGHVINVITPNAPSKSRRVVSDAHGSHILLPRRSNFFPSSHSQTLVAIEKEIRGTNPDVIDFHGTEYGYPEAGRLVKLPCVTTLQGVLAHIVPNYYGPRGVAGFFSDAVKARVGAKSIIQLLIAMWSYRSRMANEARAFRASSHFLGRTDFDREWARKLAGDFRSYHFAARILRPAFYGSSAWQPIGNRMFTVLKVGRFAPDKGNDTLVEALGRLVYIDGINACLRIVGVDQPTSGWGKTITRLARIHGVKDRIHFEGYLGASDIAQLALKSDAFALTSHSENSPNSLAEAMYVGMPCVSSDCGGVSCMITHGEHGLLYRPGDPVGLANALKSIARNRDLAARIGAAARAVAVARHDPATVADATLSAYRYAIASNTAPP
jgi:glycosyltransferase involved in cell wall biosynthesis